MSHWEQCSVPRVLIVDDNPSIHRDFDLVLLDGLQDPELEADEQRLYGRAAEPAILKPAYALDHALSGLEGIEKIKTALTQGQPYQLAFVDIRMPGIDGVETIKRLWQVDSRLQVVICTAYADYSWDTLARRLGPTDKLLVLKKPFDNLEVMLLASTLTEKWFLARQADFKLEQMELLVARRTQRLLELQRSEPTPLPVSTQATASERAETGAANLKPSLPRPSTLDPQPSEEPPLLLLVGDNAEARLAARQGLGAEYRLLEAEGGEPGVRLAQEDVPDLVITQAGTPPLDGLALCRRLKADELTSHIPVVVLGVGSQTDSQIQALEAGADDFLAHPFPLPLLKARVDNLLRARRKWQEHFSQETALHPRNLAGTQVDAVFLRKTLETVEKHLADFEFDVDTLARKLGVSRRQLFRKLRAVSGRTPNAFIRTLRLNRAAQLLKESSLTVTEITYAVGFSDLKHFRTVFREQFGLLPAEYAARQNRKGAEKE